MIGTYNYLKKYHWSYVNDAKKIVIGRDNIFYDLKPEEIITAEQRIGREFPAQLKDFYKTIGYGYLTNSFNDDKTHFIVNEILPPYIAVDYMQGILDHPEEEYYMSESSYEDLQPGDLPFFEIGDSTRFLYLKLGAKNPNAVWALGDIKIEDSFERFIYRLYYESPWFYDDIIEDYYAQKKK